MVITLGGAQDSAEGIPFGGAQEVKEVWCRRVCPLFVVLVERKARVRAGQCVRRIRVCNVFDCGTFGLSPNQTHHGRKIRDLREELPSLPRYQIAL
jgi:hypothetical protein